MAVDAGKYSDFATISFGGVRHRSVRCSPAAIATVVQLKSTATSNRLASDLHDITEV
jgi:hypothetical protein